MARRSRRRGGGSQKRAFKRGFKKALSRFRPMRQRLGNRM